MRKIFGLEPELHRTIYGVYKLQDHPSGIEESIPVVLLSGSEGPTISISANLHGDEYTGMLVIHKLLQDSSLTSQLKGTLILLPSLNPIGSLLGKRAYSLTNDDPNRLFPDENSNSKKNNFTEISMQKIFDELKHHSSFHVDFHCSKIYSVPFIYSDPLFQETKDIILKIRKAISTFGFFQVIDNVGSFFTSHYNRTFTGSLIHQAGIPAFTVELGSKKVVDLKQVENGVLGIKNLLSHLGMLDVQPVGLQTPLSYSPESYQIHLHPECPESGVVKFLVNPGDHVKKDQPVATITDIFGRKKGKGIIKTNKEGYVICQFEGAMFYSGSPILKIASKFSESEECYR
jgi:uncharacterized protein